jgi:uridine kinase
MRVTGSIKPNSGRPLIVGVAGGSGSGKTFFARELRDQLGHANCEIVYQDNFYIDQSSRFDHDGGSVNFDHPESLDFPLLAKLLAQLKTGVPVEIPVYDFVTHSRQIETIPVLPRPIIIVDGILIFHDEQVRSLFDDLVFFQTPEELRFARRLDRDVKERGRTPEGVLAQFNLQVKPMHDQFVEPSMRHANTVVCDLGSYASTLEIYVAKLSQFI